MLSIFTYAELKIEQRICVIYISIYAMVALEIIELKLSYVFLLLTMFCYLEVFTGDTMKLKLLSSPIYKVVDCIYLSVSQYCIIWVIIALYLISNTVEFKWGSYAIYSKGVSILCLSIAITNVLHQKCAVNTFNQMFQVFSEYPINGVKFNKKLEQACNILVSIEDQGYYNRKAYSVFSLSFIRYALKNRKHKDKGFVKQVQKGAKCIKDVITLKRGYSTIPMQLVRTLGIKCGYNCVIRRKIYEILYSRMFFDGIQQYYKLKHVSNRNKFKEYLLYIYFHVVQTYLGDASFSKFLNAFDMQYRKKNKIDIYGCSNEGVFIACMGLSKRATKINSDNVDYYLKDISVELDKSKILNMVENMMDKPYKGNYLQ